MNIDVQRIKSVLAANGVGSVLTPEEILYDAISKLEELSATFATSDDRTVSIFLKEKIDSAIKGCQADLATREIEEMTEIDTDD